MISDFFQPFLISWFSHTKAQ